MKTRKELKEEYKNRKVPMGVFQIKNNINGKIFVGSSIDLNAIWNRQRQALSMGSHPNDELQKDWKTYGESQFIYEILAEIEQEDNKEIDYKKEVKALEEMYIDELQPFDDKGYNKKKPLR